MSSRNSIKCAASYLNIYNYRERRTSWRLIELTQKAGLRVSQPYRVRSDFRMGSFHGAIHLRSEAAR